MRQMASSLVGRLGRKTCAILHPHAMLSMSALLAVHAFQRSDWVVWHEPAHLTRVLLITGELAIKAQPEELAPIAMPVLERLVLILAAPMGNMPRSIVENR